jgi:hypothetical protein
MTMINERNEFAIPSKLLQRVAGTTGLEPAASAVTGQRSNQLNYVPTSDFLTLIRNPRIYWLSSGSTGSLASRISIP